MSTKSLTCQLFNENFDRVTDQFRKEKSVASNRRRIDCSSRNGNSSAYVTEYIGKYYNYQLSQLVWEISFCIDCVSESVLLLKTEFWKFRMTCRALQNDRISALADAIIQPMMYFDPV